MICYGSVGNTKKPLTELRKLLTSIGPKGSFRFDVPGKSETDLKINDQVTVRLALPFAMEYEVTDKKMNLRFLTKVLGMAVLNKFVSSVEIEGLERINLALVWAPDGYLKVDS